MVDPAHVSLFKARLREADPFDALLGLARQLRDGGSTQLEVYFLFSYFQQRLSPEDPHYDAVVDNMDLIWGGAWAKGHPLFPTELTDGDVQGNRVAVPTPWVDLEASGNISLERELALEIAPGHVIAGRVGKALMRRTDCDDVLFAIVNSPEVALVHLTWSGALEPPGFPTTRLFASMVDWYEKIEREPG